MKKYGKKGNRSTMTHLKKINILLGIVFCLLLFISLGCMDNIRSYREVISESKLHRLNRQPTQLDAVSKCVSDDDNSLAIGNITIIADMKNINAIRYIKEKPIAPDYLKIEFKDMRLGLYEPYILNLDFSKGFCNNFLGISPPEEWKSYEHQKDIVYTYPKSKWDVMFMRKSVLDNYLERLKLKNERYLFKILLFESENFNAAMTVNRGIHVVISGYLVPKNNYLRQGFYLYFLDKDIEIKDAIGNAEHLLSGLLFDDLYYGKKWEEVVNKRMKEISEKHSIKSETVIR